MSYPKIDYSSVRAIRWWDSQKKKLYPGRNFSDATRACNGALVHCWNHLKLGCSIEVFNINTGRHVRTFSQRIVNGRAGVVSDKEMSND